MTCCLRKGDAISGTITEGQYGDWLRADSGKSKPNHQIPKSPSVYPAPTSPPFTGSPRPTNLVQETTPTNIMNTPATTSSLIIIPPAPAPTLPTATDQLAYHPDSPNQPTHTIEPLDSGTSSLTLSLPQANSPLPSHLLLHQEDLPKQLSILAPSLPERTLINVPITLLDRPPILQQTSWDSNTRPLKPIHPKPTDHRKQWRRVKGKENAIPDPPITRSTAVKAVGLK